jgi:hypothetical protein
LRRVSSLNTRPFPASLNFARCSSVNSRPLFAALIFARASSLNLCPFGGITSLNNYFIPNPHIPRMAINQPLPLPNKHWMIQGGAYFSTIIGKRCYSLNSRLANLKGPPPNALRSMVKALYLPLSQIS